MLLCLRLTEIGVFFIRREAALLLLGQRMFTAIVDVW